MKEDVKEGVEEGVEEGVKGTERGLLEQSPDSARASRFVRIASADAPNADPARAQGQGRGSPGSWGHTCSRPASSSGLGEV